MYIIVQIRQLALLFPGHDKIVLYSIREECKWSTHLDLEHVVSCLVVSLAEPHYSISKGTTRRI